MDEKSIIELARRVGIDVSDDEIADKAEMLQSKDERELLTEIMALKEQLKKNPAAFDKQMSALKSLLPVMNSKQREKLKMIIELLEK